MNIARKGLNGGSNVIFDKRIVCEKLKSKKKNGLKVIRTPAFLAGGTLELSDMHYTTEPRGIAKESFKLQFKRCPLL